MKKAKSTTSNLIGSGGEIKVGLEQGQSLVEVLVALGVFAISVTAIFVLVFGGQSLSVGSAEEQRALEYAAEGITAVRTIRERNWNELSSGQHGLIFQNGQWEFSGSQDTKDIFTRVVSVADAEVNIKYATVTVSWNTDPLRTQKVELVARFANWQNPLSGGCVKDALNGDWTSPNTLGSADLGPGNEGTDVVVKMPYAYVSGTASASEKPDLFTFDVSDPANPVLTSQLDIGSDGINSLFISGDKLYAASANDNREFMVFSLANPAMPTELSTLNLSGLADGLSVSVFDSIAAVGRTGGDELVFIDVSDPSNPSVIRSFDAGGAVTDLTSSNQKLYAAVQDDANDVRVYDISNPSNPVFETAFDIPDPDNIESIAFQVSPTHLLTGDSRGGLSIIGATTTDSMYVRSTFNVPGGGNIFDIVCVSDQQSNLDLAFLATKSSNSEFSIVNITDPDNPSLHASLDLPQLGRGIDFASNTVFMSLRSNDALRIIGPKTEWWSSNYTYRRQLTINTGANSPASGYDGYTVRLTGFNTSSLIPNKMQDDCDDLRVIYKSDSGFVELDRQIFNCNTGSTEVRFKLQRDIPANSFDNNYYIYYGNPNAFSGPSNLSNVYLWYDDASSDRESEYIQGRVDETAHGAPKNNWGNTIAWNSAGYYTYDTGDNYPDSMRPAGITERDIYIEYEEYQTNAWPFDMTSGPLVRWVGTGSGATEESSHWYYYEMADSTFQPGSPYVSHDDITADNRQSVIIEHGTLGEFPPRSWTRIALAAWGANPTNLRAWYDPTPTDQESGGWGEPRFSGVHSASSDNENAGQFGVWVQQDTGRIRNIIARKYTHPEPSVSIGGEQRQ